VYLLHQRSVALDMAKTDSFFIRAIQSTNGTTIATDTIDLGAFVDALGEHVLRIHNITVQISDAGGAVAPITVTANSEETLFWQLTTQNNGAIVTNDDKSLVAGGRMLLVNVSGSSGLTDVVDIGDRADQWWTNGYLIAVENMFLSVDLTAAPVTGDINVAVIMECTSEKLTKGAAMALALSQQ